ncbi:hypothetical protein ABZ079_09840 [Streptomyces sp. NPDC006314]|uniref:hypothetical protein n=1 Tax=Streptomyces sp. NPDC006314 TaxID=3154475 RepID=UPI0033B554AB
MKPVHARLRDVPSLACGESPGNRRKPQTNALPYPGAIQRRRTKCRHEAARSCSFVGCGRCWYCAHDPWSLCDNTNTNPGIGQALFGADTGGIFGYSHAMGGLRGSHAEYVRVPFADYGAFPVPEGVDDTSALFVSDSVPRAGWAPTWQG